MVKPRVYPKAANQSQQELENEKTEFLIKARYNKFQFKNDRTYIMDGGKISFDVKNREIVLNWGKIIPEQNAQVEVEYTVLVTFNQNARLESNCILKIEVQKELEIHSFSTKNTNYKFVNLPRKEEGASYYINVVALVRGLDEDAEIIPYTPIEVYIAGQNIPTIYYCKT